MQYICPVCGGEMPLIRRENYTILYRCGVCFGELVVRLTFEFTPAFPNTVAFVGLKKATLALIVGSEEGGHDQP